MGSLTVPRAAAPSGFRRMVAILGSNLRIAGSRHTSRQLCRSLPPRRSHDRANIPRLSHGPQERPPRLRTTGPTEALAEHLRHDLDHVSEFFAPAPAYGVNTGFRHGTLETRPIAELVARLRCSLPPMIAASAEPRTTAAEKTGSCRPAKAACHARMAMTRDRPDQNRGIVRRSAGRLRIPSASKIRLVAAAAHSEELAR